ncbi:rCG62344 [Rattus norvegicus]|uniref:RCG62344 n=1 Tax=Rattus norvegicus TaxID=10116 RepID=A6HAX7_RAT|nr:rCG62344 [Rattus norvegicus]
MMSHSSFLEHMESQKQTPYLFQHCQGTGSCPNAETYSAFLYDATPSHQGLLLLETTIPCLNHCCSLDSFYPEPRGPRPTQIHFWA